MGFHWATSSALWTSFLRIKRCGFYLVAWLFSSIYLTSSVSYPITRNSVPNQSTHWIIKTVLAIGSISEFPIFHSTCFLSLTSSFTQLCLPTDTWCGSLLSGMVSDFQYPSSHLFKFLQPGHPHARWSTSVLGDPDDVCYVNETNSGLK